MADWTKAPRPGVRSRKSAVALDGRSMTSAVKIKGAVPEVETWHEVASYRARDMATWSALRVSPDTALLSELDTAAARIDDLARNDGIAAGAERTFVDNVVGPRIMCKPNPDWVALGKSEEWVDEWSRQVESLFQSWTDSPYYDAGRRFNFHTSTRIQARMIASSGECLALPLWVENPWTKWSTCMQMVDPARLSNLDMQGDTVFRRGGIDIDERGAPVAYSIRKTHPGDFFTGVTANTNTFAWERVPAFTEWGRPRVLHLFEPDRVGQSRGKSVVTAVARQFKMLSHYMREQLRLAVLNSMIFATLETPLDATGIEAIYGSSDQGALAGMQDAMKDWRIQMKGGTMLPLPPGTKMDKFVPGGTPSIDSFATTIIRGIGTGLNMPYELVFRDFSKCNYSSARAALLEAWRYFAAVRGFMREGWCAPNYTLWFEEAVSAGKIPDCTPQMFYDNPLAWTRCRWIFSGRGWVDPLKEAKGSQIRLITGVSSLADECGEQGRDWREQIAQIAREKRECERQGLPWPMNAAVKPEPVVPSDFQSDGQGDESAQADAEAAAEEAAAA